MSAMMKRPLWVPSFLRDEVREMAARRPSLGQACCVTQRKPEGALAFGHSTVRRGGMLNSGVWAPASLLPRLHPLLAILTCRPRAGALEPGRPGFTFQLHLFLVG